MDSGTYSIYKSRCNDLMNDKNNFFEYNFLSNYEYFEDVLSEEEFNDIVKYNRCRRNKRNRTSKKLMEMLKFMYWNNKYNNTNYVLVFGTCTLNDIYLLNRKEETRLKLLSQYLMRHYEVALLNKDFGSINEREHYHFIGITSENLEFKEQDGKIVKSKKGFPLYELEIKDYKLGFEPTLELINTIDLDKLKNYLLKLNNHSNKSSTRQRLRFFKNNRYIAFELVNSKCKKKSL